MCGEVRANAQKKRLPAILWPRSGSPVSDDGRGLKPWQRRNGADVEAGSPVSDDGRGLKLHTELHRNAVADGSPVSDDGRGLKLFQARRAWPRKNGFARQR